VYANMLNAMSVDVKNKLMLDGLVLLKQLAFDYPQDIHDNDTLPHITEVWVPALVTAIDDKQFSAHILKSNNMMVIDRNQHGHTWRFI
jgi:hypothetical protein